MLRARIAISPPSGLKTINVVTEAKSMRSFLRGKFFWSEFTCVEKHALLKYSKRARHFTGKNNYQKRGLIRFSHVLVKTHLLFLSLVIVDGCLPELKGKICIHPSMPIDYPAEADCYMLTTSPWKTAPGEEARQEQPWSQFIYCKVLSFCHKLQPWNSFYTVTPFF